MNDQASREARHRNPHYFEGRGGDGYQFYATGPGVPSSTNVFVPNWESSGRLAIGFSRNAKRFPLPNYVQYRESDLSVGLFLKLSYQEQARVITPQEFEWPDKQVRPLHTDGDEQFDFQYFRTHRYDYGVPVGYMTRDQADWPLIEWYKAIKAQQMMTARTYRMLAALTTSTNWTVAGTATTEFDMVSDHTATAASFAGGQLDLGTSTSPYIKIFFDKAEALINLETTGIITRPALACVINPNQARLWAESAEIHEYIKGSYWAKEELNKGLSPNNKFGLPSELYGMRIIVENSVRVTSRKGATLAKSLIMPDQTALILAIDGNQAIDLGDEGQPPIREGKAAMNFSTATMFWYEDEMTVEEFDDPKNRLTELHVTENTTEVVTCPTSGYYLTSTTSVAS